MWRFVPPKEVKGTGRGLKILAAARLPLPLESVIFADVKLQSIYESRRAWKWTVAAVSGLLVAAFLVISNRLVADLAAQERERMELWADATAQLASPQAFDESAQHIDFLLSIIERNHTIPVMLTDDRGNILLQRNFRLPEPEDTLAAMPELPENVAYLQRKLARLRSGRNTIDIAIDAHTTQHLYYEDSTLLRRLAYFPYVELVVLLVFIVITYMALVSVKRAEQNRVWVGLSKETAHQLGTPISSLMAWGELLPTLGVDADIVADMNKDVRRLNVIAERFSKIGSKPKMDEAEVAASIAEGMAYMAGRISKRVALTIDTAGAAGCRALLCQPLFEWVMENLTKNAVDAMQGEGALTVTATGEAGTVVIDVTDTGKGIAKKNFKTVFNPGYTTKSRGWGLGLTLVKRIIEQYHGGRIFVLQSRPGQGTTMRIVLPCVQ